MGLQVACFVLIPNLPSATHVLCDLRQTPFPVWAYKDYTLIQYLFGFSGNSGSRSVVCRKELSLYWFQYCPCSSKAPLRCGDHGSALEGHLHVERPPPGWGSDRNSCHRKVPSGLSWIHELWQHECRPIPTPKPTNHGHSWLLGLSFLFCTRRGEGMTWICGFQTWVLLQSTRGVVAVLLKLP